LFPTSQTKEDAFGGCLREVHAIYVYRVNITFRTSPSNNLQSGYRERRHAPWIAYPYPTCLRAGGNLADQLWRCCNLSRTALWNH